MGYVTENDTAAPRQLHRTAFDRESGTRKTDPPYPFSPSVRTQRGYRSGPLSPEEKSAIRQADATGVVNTATAIDTLEKIERATSSTPCRVARPFIVNERDFTSLTRSPARVDYDKSYRSSGVDYSWSGNTYVALSNIRSPWGRIDPDSFRAEAGAIMRAMTPTKPEFNLTRFVFELRDTNQLFRIDPNALAEFGGTYLKYQFGVSPTVSDIKSGAEAVVKADQIFGQYLRDVSQEVYRSRTRILDRQVGTVSTSKLIPGLGVGVNDVWLRDDTGNFRWRVLTLNTPDHGPTNVNSSMLLDYSATRTVHAFSTFEYFVGDPDGFLGRLEGYVQKAKQVLGGGLDAPTTWELTPWSWLVDWFFDIGGFLQYQQLVADNGIVANRSGFTVTDDIVGALTLTPRGSGSTIRRPAYSGIRLKESFRRPGSPYSMDLNWNLSGFQWSILGALGLTKGPRVPFLRWDL